MAKRLRIGVIFSYEERWIGGTYYLLNIINALNTLSDKDKPIIAAFIHNQRDKEVLLTTSYPYLKTYPLFIHSRWIRRFDYWLKKLSRWHIRIIELWQNSKVDVVYLFSHDLPIFNKIKKKVFWVADFQEFVLPEFFTAEEVAQRSALPRYVANTSHTLIVSSNNAKHHFDCYLPNHKCNVKVVRFASSQPSLDGLSIEKVREKYKVNDSYFLCANQFWQHKNHEVVLKAAKLLKDEKNTFQIILTGKNFDYRKNNYFPSLMEFINENELQEQVKYIGFIDRGEQLLLMKHAIAVIQPSLFEGWSTTVEDAKNLNKRIILSDIPVHVEQKDENTILFDPNSPIDLQNILSKNMNKDTLLNKYSYDKNVIRFAKDFMSAICYH